MANKYVRSGAGGAGTGADWANAYTTLTAAIAGSAAGDDLWVAGDHAESTAGAVTLTFPGTSASPNRVICVDHAGTVPPVSADLRTTGTVSTTGANALTIRGHAYIEGLIFQAGSAASSANLAFGNGAAAGLTFKNCGLVLNNSSASSSIQVGLTSNIPGEYRLINTPMTFGNVSQTVIATRCRFIWENTQTAIVGSVPTNLFTCSTDATGHVTLRGVDLSAAGAGKNIFASSTQASFYLLQDCKLGASVTVLAVPSTFGSSEAHVIRGNSGAVSYTHEKHNYLGAETIETTIVRTGGASVNGTAISKKIITTANTKFYRPFISMPIAVANSTTGSNRVVTVYGIWGGGAVPNNDDIWFEVEYLGSALTPISTFKSTAKADVLAAGAAHSSDTSTWGGSTTDFKMTTTLSSPQPAMDGEMYVRIYCATASTTFYIDPKVELS